MIPATEPSVVALVPMRHHSERVKGKNYRLIAGKPLYAYIIETLLECVQISKIVVDTDSPVINQGLEEAYPQVEIIQRPHHLTADDISMNEILIHDLEQVEGDFFLQTHSTNPLIRAETIVNAIETFFLGWPESDSLFSVTPFQTRLWTSGGEPVNHDPRELIPTQDLEPLLVENSCLYIFSRNTLNQHQNRIGKTPILFDIEDEEALDIDNEWELKLAEYFLQARKDEA